MAKTGGGKKYIEIQGYSYKRDGKVVQVPRHDRSNPHTSHGKGKPKK